MYTAGASEAVDIDLCGSLYDTKLYVYDSGLALVACNDDFYSDAVCGTFVSKLENVLFNAGETYYIVIDGYGGAFGDYILNVYGFEPCVIDCVGMPEGEGDVYDGYVDNYNGGCNAAGFPFQNLSGDASGNLTLCGIGGWYLSNTGGSYRDTDWYILTMGPGGVIDVTMDAEYPTYFFELGPQDCASVGVIQQPIAGPCVEAYMTISGYAPGAAVWFWAGASAWEATGNYDYVCWFSGLDTGVATEATSWSNVKALFE